MAKLKSHFQGDVIVRASAVAGKLLVATPDAEVHIVSSSAEAKELAEAWFKKHAKGGMTFNVGTITWDGCQPPT